MSVLKMHATRDLVHPISFMKALCLILNCIIAKCLNLPSVFVVNLPFVLHNIVSYPMKLNELILNSDS